VWPGQLRHHAGVITDRPDAAPLHEQIGYLAEALRHNRVAQALLEVAADMALPNWYFGAGGVSQTVWNLRHGFDPEAGIKDYDIAYFDPNLSSEAERRIEEELTHRLSVLNVALDVNNEARVHLWYAERFGRAVDPYVSTEDAISTWPTTASCVGVRLDPHGFVVCAPYGLTDVFGMVARPNKKIVTREIYEEKTGRWMRRWPRLNVLPW
jgi:hypothetical protein